MIELKNKRAVGTVYEERARTFLKEQGYQIVECNFRCREGEIDIIAKDGEVLAFVEVKYRCNLQKGHPFEAVTVTKQRRISRCARYYLYRHGLQGIPCRFDVIGILEEEILLQKNAFDYVE